MQKPLLEVKNIKKYYKLPTKHPFAAPKYLKAVNDVSFNIKKGTTFGLVGESGCGKTTIGNVIGGLSPLTDGDIYFNGTNVSTNAKEIKKNIQIIFQDPYNSLNPKKTIGWILTEPLRIHQKATKKEMKATVIDFLKIAGFDKSYYNKYPHELSGGQRQRIVILCALILNPELIIADEPVSALDVSVQASILNFMKHLQQTYNLTYLFISHDLNVVQYMSDVIGVMYLGKIVEIAPVDELYHHPKHPYTKALLSVIPNIHESDTNTEKIVLEGDIPNSAEPPSGCPFHTRCPFSMERCVNRLAPSLNEVENQHWVACHLHTHNNITQGGKY